MFSRREVLFAGAGVLGARAAPRRHLVVHSGRGDGRLAFLGQREDVDLEALDGLGARFLSRRVFPSTAAPVLAIDLCDDAGELWLPGADRPCFVRLPEGPSLFAAAWALPALGVGNFLAYDPGDVAQLVQASSTAEFHRLDDASAMPRSLRTCRAACMTYFGEGLSLARLNDVASRLEQQLPTSADFLLATAEHRGWSPRVLLTVFD
jgi:hypothetical protein